MVLYVSYHIITLVVLLFPREVNSFSVLVSLSKMNDQENTVAEK